MQRISTGNAPLDQILGGGFLANSINVIMGPPGSGKTLMAEQLAFANAGPDSRVLYLSTLSEPLAKLLTYLGELEFADVDRIGPELVYEDLGPELMAAPEKIDEVLLARIQAVHPRIIVIDSFKAIGDMFADCALWRRVLSRLAGLLSAYRTTTFWIGEYDLSTIADRPEFAVADGIIHLGRASGLVTDRELQVVKLRGSAFADGRHAFRLGRSGLEVFPRLVTPRVAADYTTSAERLASGITGLDELIATGWLRGTTTLVAGPTGAGKTVMGLHFLRQGALSGEPGLLVNLQENPVQITRTIAGFGWDPDEILGPGKVDVLYASPVELQLDAFMAEILARTARHGVRRLVLDSLADVLHAARDEERFRDCLYSLVQYLATSGITAILTLEMSMSKGASDFWGHDVSFLADNLVLLGLELGDDLTRTLRVLKSRTSAHDGHRRRMVISASGISVMDRAP